MTKIATECPVCPKKGIVSCAHLGDRVVWLTDTQAVVQHEVPAIASQRWHVAGPRALVQCPCSVEHTVMDWHLIFRTDSLPDAEAEFRRRERLLRET